MLMSEIEKSYYIIPLKYRQQILPWFLLKRRVEGKGRKNFSRLPSVSFPTNQSTNYSLGTENEQHITRFSFSLSLSIYLSISFSCFTYELLFSSGLPPRVDSRWERRVQQHVNCIVVKQISFKAAQRRRKGHKKKKRYTENACGPAM